jgi:predicted ATPase
LKRFIICGAPGAGKTAIIRELEFDGFGVVEEAATDVIAKAQAAGKAEPWTDPSFIDTVARLQQEREIWASSQPDHIQFHDRSVVCTAALAVYLGFPFSAFLTEALNRIKKESVFQRRVFFVRSLGFITPTAARRISLAEAERFEKIHEEIYRDFGFELVSIEAGSVAERVATIKAAVHLDPRGAAGGR